MLREIYEEHKQGKDIPKEILEIVSTLYHKKGLGIKWLVKHYYPDMTYTTMRKFLINSGIGIRTGKSVVTNNLKKFRKAKALRENKLDIGFNKKSRIRKGSDRRGICGYYYNKSLGKYVYLRSTWEYIYAKWLDRTSQVWDVETRYYILEDKSKYLPDFFIYENGIVNKIIEIKGYWDCRAYKVQMLNKVVDAEVIIIRDISKYIPNNSNYHKELDEWKSLRLKELLN